MDCSTMICFLRPGSYWAKGSIAKLFSNSAQEPRRRFPVALSKDGGKGVTAVSSSMDALVQHGGLLCPPPWLHVGNTPAIG